MRKTEVTHHDNGDITVRPAPALFSISAFFGKPIDQIPKEKVRAAVQQVVDLAEKQGVKVDLDPEVKKLLED